MKILFFGSDTFAIPSLRILHASSSHKIIGVVTQPDKPAGRGREITPCPIADLAKELDLDFVSFNLTNPHHGSQLKKMVEDNYELNREVYYDTEARQGNEIYFFQPGLPVDYLKKAYKTIPREFYLRITYILKMLTHIRNFSMFKSYAEGLIRILRIKVVR